MDFLILLENNDMFKVLKRISVEDSKVIEALIQRRLLITCVTKFSKILILKLAVELLIA